MKSASAEARATIAAMYKYGGIVIHQSRDEHGPVEIVEDGYSRSLHFGSEPKQSSMDLHDPQRLALTYTRAMMSALLFNDSPQRVLLIGLGGGSLAKFLLHYFPACRIDAVEYREHVYKLACGYFKLPESPRLSIHFADGADFVRQTADGQPDYDLILIDAFDSSGIARSTSSQDFFDACRRSTAAAGVLVANLWTSDRVHLDDQINAIATSFEQRVLRLPVEGKANVIALAFASGSPRRELRRLGEQARLQQQRLGIEFTALHNALRRHNRWWF